MNDKVILPCIFDASKYTKFTAFAKIDDNYYTAENLYALLGCYGEVKNTPTFTEPKLFEKESLPTFLFRAFDLKCGDKVVKAFLYPQVFDVYEEVNKIFDGHKTARFFFFIEDNNA